MTHFDLAAVFLGLAAAVGWLNARLIRLPSSVAMLAVGVLGALALIFGRRFAGVSDTADALSRMIARVNFPETVVGYMLAFLLFAGAMQVDLNEIRQRRFAVVTLATLGVVASTLIVGFGLFGLARLLGAPLPLPWAMVFGALISPTDPVAVLSTVKSGALPLRIRSTLQGEALFNDGVGIVVFLAALAIASNGHQLSVPKAALEVLIQALGGAALGVGAGWIVTRAIGSIDDYAVEVTLTVALAAGVYAGGQALHVSGPIAAVAAGLMIGDRALCRAMSQTTRRYVQGFWVLVDELLNALLFLLLGLQTAVLPFQFADAALCAAAIPLVLAARFAVVLPWGAYYRFRHSERGASLILAWGGLRGALSLALALQTPRGPEHVAILSATYAVVVFGVLVQGLSFPHLVAWLAPQEAAEDAAEAARDAPVAG